MQCKRVCASGTCRCSPVLSSNPKSAVEEPRRHCCCCCRLQLTCEPTHPSVSPQGPSAFSLPCHQLQCISDIADFRSFKPPRTPRTPRTPQNLRALAQPYTKMIPLSVPLSCCIARHKIPHPTSHIPQRAVHPHPIASPPRLIPIILPSLRDHASSFVTFS